MCACASMCACEAVVEAVVVLVAARGEGRRARQGMVCTLATHGVPVHERVHVCVCVIKRPKIKNLNTSNEK